MPNNKTRRSDIPVPARLVSPEQGPASAFLLNFLLGMSSEVMAVASPGAVAMTPHQVMTALLNAAARVHCTPLPDGGSRYDRRQELVDEFRDTAASIISHILAENDEPANGEPC